jgi:hypothetical protein
MVSEAACCSPLTHSSQNWSYCPMLQQLTPCWRLQDTVTHMQRHVVTDGPILLLHKVSPRQVERIGPNQ